MEVTADYSDVDLRSMTINQLRELLEDLNIYWDGDMTRDELILQYDTAVNQYYSGIQGQ
uniref:SAP domain-containing protein n=1 Tax=viral metagenome TaxID=1070528 RepID=A0A6C0BME3_9ZZZZ